jgi:hypothetical protein
LHPEPITFFDLKSQKNGLQLANLRSKVGAAGVLMHKTLQPSLDMVAVWILFF